MTVPIVVLVFPDFVNAVYLYLCLSESLWIYNSIEFFRGFVYLWFNYLYIYIYIIYIFFRRSVFVYLYIYIYICINTYIIRSTKTDSAISPWLEHRPEVINSLSKLAAGNKKVFIPYRSLVNGACFKQKSAWNPLKFRVLGYVSLIEIGGSRRNVGNIRDILAFLIMTTRPLFNEMCSQRPRSSFQKLCKSESFTHNFSTFLQVVAWYPPTAHLESGIVH